MNWLTPQIGAIAAAIAVPALVILYFLKLKRREVEVSSTLLWKKAIQDLQANAPFQKLRRNLLLFLQLLALAAALLALGQPELEAGAGAGRKTVILIDRSASMSTLDGAEGAFTRLDQAKKEALAHVNAMHEPSLLGAGERDEAMVIAFDATAEVVQPWTPDKARLKRAVESIGPTDATSSLDEAARLAGAYAQPVMIERRGLVAPPGAPIHLWSDGRLPDAPRVSVREGTPVVFRAIGGADTPNIAVTAFRAERSLSAPGKAQVFVGLQSTADAERQVDVEFAVDGVVFAVRRVTVGPRVAEAAEQGAGGETAQARARPGAGGVVFELEREQGALLRVRAIVEADTLPIDNEAWLVLPPARRLSALYVSPSPTFVLDALEAQDFSRLVSATPAQWERMRAEGRDAEFDVVVLDGWAPVGELPPGRYLVFGAIPGIEGVSAKPGASDKDRADHRVVIDWARDHGALRSVSLESLAIARGLALEAGPNATVLAQSNAGPLIVEAASAGARAIVVAFGVMDSNWIWDYNHVLFVAAATRHLAGVSGGSPSAEAKLGGTLTARLPPDARDVKLTLPDGTTTALAPAQDGRVTYGPVRRLGVHRLDWTGSAGVDDRAGPGGSATRFVVANLLDPFESDVGAVARLDLASGTVTAQASGAGVREAARRLWPWLLAGALALLMLEWWVYNRKVVI